MTPHPIENLFKTICPIVSYCVLIGDERKFLSMVITLKLSFDKQGRFTNILDPNVQSFLFRRFNKTFRTIEDAKYSKEVTDYINMCVLEANNKAQNRVHMIKKWIILDNEFSVDQGELTQTLKIKRKVIANMYKKQIDKIYDDAEGGNTVKERPRL